MTFHPLRVARIVPETDDARSYVLDVPEAQRARFACRAGQFLTFRVAPGGEGAEPLLRCYSLSSCPETGDALQVTVKRIAGGRVSTWFHEHLREGEVLDVQAPAGRFVLHPGDRPLLLYAAGSGITPVISLVRAALATTRRRARLVYANRDREAVIFRQALGALAHRHPERLEVRHHLDVERGLLGAEEAAAHAAGLEDAEAYLCGPAPFMEVVEAGLGRAGFDRERIRIERFEAPVHEAVAEPAAGRCAEVPDEIVVHLEGRAHRVPYRAGQSILRAAQAAGLDPPFSCEEGYCGSCAARCLRGRVEMAVNDVFSPREVAAGSVLTCQGRPVGETCEISYDDSAGLV